MVYTYKEEVTNMNIKEDLSLLMDFYELTMSNSFFKHNKNKKAVFDMFYRSNPDESSYAIFAGLEHLINYIQNLHFSTSDIDYLRSLNIFDEDFLTYLKNFKFKGDIYSFKEGSVIYPNEPIVTVIGDLIECQLIETCLLVIINHESLIASKANRIYLACRNIPFADFGARRGHNFASSLYGARASYLGGASSTATTLAGKLFHIPVSGTMAHSYIMSFDSEYEAFLTYAKDYEDSCTLLIDTYDVIHSGLKNAIKVYKDYLKPRNKMLKGVRIDSGDLAYLSKKCRKILDENGLKETKIIVSNSLDEEKIRSLLDQKAKIDIFGIGENLITSKSNPVFGGVYKLVGIYKDDVLIPKIKISNTIEKITNPGLKNIFRVYDKDNKVVADLLTLANQNPIDNEKFEFIDPNKPWKNMAFENCSFKNMHEHIFKNGELIYTLPSLDEIKKYVREQVDVQMWEEERRFIMPHVHYLDFSKEYYSLKKKLIEEYKYE